ncbi:MAG: acetate--CoA ligase family protein, partial [Actinomycetota bacterium]|nr:acetate--CoA ligase family protein [Actinomycetota bacterium]
LGHAVLRNLQRSGFAGPVWAVNPHADHVRSLRAVPSILDIPDEVDLAVIAVPAPAVAGVVEECGRKQVYGVVVLSAGFAEVGDEGAAMEAEVLRTARLWGIRVIGPNCLGLINTDPDVRLHATFVSINPTPGRVSLLSESGMVGAAIVDQASELGIGISSFVALGNRVDVSGNDLLQYWEDDEGTDVVCLYLESFGNPRRFSRLARGLTRQKPVVAVKAGWSPDGSPPAWSGGDLDDALLRQTGVIRVPSLAAMLDTTRILISQPLPAGNRVAIVGNAGGSLAIVADAVLAAGLVLADLQPGTLDGLAELGVRVSSLRHPVDLGLLASTADFEGATEQLAADPGVDAVIAVFAPSLGALAADALVAIERGQAAEPSVPVVGCFYGRIPPRSDEGPGVPMFSSVEAAARALGRVSSYAAWLRRDDGPVLELDTDAATTASDIVAAALDRGIAHLDDATVAEVLEAAGVPVIATRSASSLVEALDAAGELGYPVALKAAGRDERAKTAAAGLALDLESPAALKAAWDRMGERLGDRVVPAVVQPMVDPGVDVAVDIVDDPTVGPVLSIRPGGAHAALDHAANVRVLPVGASDLSRLVAESRLGPILDDASRGSLEVVLARLTALVDAVPEISRVAINPMIVDATGTTSIGARIDVAAAFVDRSPDLRRV